MTDRIIKILQSNVTTAVNDLGHPIPILDADADDIKLLAADLSAAFEKRLRNELELFAYHFNSSVADNIKHITTEDIDGYLKFRKNN